MSRSGKWRMVLAAAGLAVAAAAGTVPAAAAVPATAAPAHDPGVFGFGRNEDGELGNGGTTDRSLGHPLGLPAGVRQVAAGGFASAALLPDGTVSMWGAITGSVVRTRPTPVLGLAGITQIAVSLDGGDILAVGPGGSVWDFGHNENGQLGNGSTANNWVPAPVPGLTGVTQVSAGSGYALALRSDGTVWAWGLNAYGELGDGTTTDRHTPEQVPGLSGITQVDAGNTSFAVRSDGTLLDWGKGFLGDGTGSRSVTVPQPVPGLDGITQVAGVGAQAGVGHTLALRSDGTVWSWGDNADGEVGDGTANVRLSPERLALSPVTRVAVGGQQSAAALSDGTLLTWGDNLEGGLDINPAIGNSPVPTLAVGLTWVTQVAFGYDYGLALSTVPAGIVTVPDVTGVTQAQASQALRAAGLFLGAVTTKADLTCDDIGLVLSQRPAGGAYASRNTSVSVTIGKLPPKCF